MSPHIELLTLKLIQHILDTEEPHYEQTLDEHGPDSEPARSHIYSLAWSLATELEATL